MYGSRPYAAPPAPPAPPSRTIVPPSPIVRFLVDADGQLHVEAAPGQAADALTYLRAHLDEWEDKLGLEPPPPPPPPSPAEERAALQGHGGRPSRMSGGSRLSPAQREQVKAQHPGTFGGFAPEAPPPPARPTPPYGPAPMGAPLPVVAAPPGFAYGHVPPEQYAAAARGPNTPQYGWVQPPADQGAAIAANGHQAPPVGAPFYPPGGPGAAPPPQQAYAPPQASGPSFNPPPGMCTGCMRALVACDAQPGICPAALARARAAANPPVDGVQAGAQAAAPQPQPPEASPAPPAAASTSIPPPLIPVGAAVPNGAS